MRPRYIRIYDNGGKTVDRYTVVYTRKSITRERPYWYMDVCMSGSPFHPQGVCQHGEYTYLIDRPTYSHLGRKITWNDLPEDCKGVVMQDYAELWGDNAPMIH